MVSKLAKISFPKVLYLKVSKRILVNYFALSCCKPTMFIMAEIRYQNIKWILTRSDNLRGQKPFGVALHTNECLQVACTNKE